MSFIKADRVQETSTSTGTGNITLAGAYDVSFRTFDSVMADNDTAQVLILNADAPGEWETDEATYDQDTNAILRTQVISSSNAGAAVNFSSGTKIVAMLPIASTMVVEDNSGNAAISGTLSVGTGIVSDVPAFTSRFVGVSQVPPLTSSSSGALAEVISLGIEGTGNFGAGQGALANMANGAVNVAVGYNALNVARHEAFSTAVGWGALATSEGYENTGIGYRSFPANTSGIQNTGIGSVSGYSNTTGSYNTALGSHSQTYGTTGGSNTSAGYESLFNNNGEGNSAFGTYAMLTNTTGLACCAFGVGAMYTNNASSNSAFGYETSKDNSAGTGNSSFGRSALIHGLGSNNSAMGFQAGAATGLTASGLALFGAQAGVGLTGAADNNTLIGFSSGASATTGTGNVLIGASPDSPSYGQVTTGSRNVSVGYDVAVASPTANNQLNFSNFVYGTGMDGTGSSISAGKIGLGVKAPETVLHLSGPITINPTTAPASPTVSGAVVLYVDSGDGNKLKAKASNGTVATLLTP